ncbi:MAG: class I SAM-dependent methyltransferase [Planctomycetaceae bacterium]
MSRHSPDCYDAPGYWDLAFSDETLYEADFIEAAAAHYLKTSQPRILEIGCGGGRQVVELAKRGHHVRAFDLNESCVAWTQRQLKRRHLTAQVFSDDMTCFKLNRPVHLAHCLVNTFRHLLTEEAARRHLQCVADSLRPGGIYLLGFHLLPPDAAEEDCERWTINHRRTRVTTTIRVLDFSRRTRIETVRFSLKVTTPTKVLRLSTDHQLRIYRADQFRSLLRSVPAFRLLDVFDFCYDINEPLMLNDDLGDAVFVLQKQ